MGVAIKNTRNPAGITYLYETSLYYVHCATKIATACTMTERD